METPEERETNRLHEEGMLTHEDAIERQKKERYEAWLNDQPIEVVRLIQANDITTLREAKAIINEEL